MLNPVARTTFLDHACKAAAWLCALGLLASVVSQTQPVPGTVFAFLRWPGVVLALILGAIALQRDWHRTSTALAFSVMAAVGDWSIQYLMQARPSLAEAPQRLTVMTANLCFRPGNMEAVVEALSKNEVDMLLLQEVTPAWHKMLERSLAARYPHRPSRPQEGVSGFAMFSRVPLQRVTYVNRAGASPFAQCALVPRDNGKTPMVCNVHMLGSPIRFTSLTDVATSYHASAQARASEWHVLLDHVERNNAPVHVLAGDFNTLEWEPLHATMRRTHVDVFRYLRWEPGFTFPVTPRLPLGPIIRIDYVLTAGEVLPLATDVVPLFGSDHQAVMAVLDL